VADVAGLSLDELMVSVRDLVARTRTGRLKNSEMTGGTITVSSMGDKGADSLYGVIYPPQVALLGFGTPVMRPRVVDGEVRPRMTVIATLAADHRVSDGRRGARLLSDIAKYLEEPEAL
jgi:pyruvate dehydrogenase E2 component (dihydrolipoamide acetyltransferase)